MVLQQREFLSRPRSVASCAASGLVLFEALVRPPHPHAGPPQPPPVASPAPSQRTCLVAPIFVENDARSARKSDTLRGARVCHPCRWAAVVGLALLWGTPGNAPGGGGGGRPHPVPRSTSQVDQCVQGHWVCLGVPLLASPTRGRGLNIRHGPAKAKSFEPPSEHGVARLEFGSCSGPYLSAGVGFGPRAPICPVGSPLDPPNWRQRSTRRPDLVSGLGPDFPTHSLDPGHSPPVERALEHAPHMHPIDASIDVGNGCSYVDVGDVLHSVCCPCAQAVRCGTSRSSCGMDCGWASMPCSRSHDLAR